jgi:hypothetical protein
MKNISFYLAFLGAGIAAALPNPSGEPHTLWIKRDPSGEPHTLWIKRDPSGEPHTLWIKRDGTENEA